jgi:hypothetical protein
VAGGLKLLGPVLVLPRQRRSTGGPPIMFRLSNINFEYFYCYANFSRITVQLNKNLCLKNNNGDGGTLIAWTDFSVTAKASGEL